MKRLIKLSVTLLVLLFVATSINAQTHGHKKMMNVKKFDKNHDGMVYQCPMCADEISDKPGECPKCGMEMKKVTLTEAQKALNDISNDDAYVPGGEKPSEHYKHMKMHKDDHQHGDASNDDAYVPSKKKSGKHK